MAQSDAIWNEAARIINEEFMAYEQPITGALLKQLIIVLTEQLR